MMSLDRQITTFYSQLSSPRIKEKGVGILNPFVDSFVMELAEQFYKRFYRDYNPRVFLIGINPGRFGAGITGLPFTDPVRLQNELGIANDFDKKQELSSVFVYEIIEALGGPADFYRNFYFTSVSPLGFVKQGKNLNYYDIPDLQNELTPWMVAQMSKQVVGWGRRDVAFSVGKGKNLKVLKDLNREHGWFERVESIPHPRWVLQYRRRQKDEILDEVIEKLSSTINY